MTTSTLTIESTTANPAHTRFIPVCSIASAVYAFDTISLDEIKNSDARLLNRKEMKFLMTLDQCIELLSGLTGAYRVLEVNTCRVSGYETKYYDTDTFMTYLQHHNGKAHRYKLRVRHYASSGETYLEIKEKRNTGRTIKKRLETGDHAPLSEPRQEAFLASAFPYDYRAFHPVLATEYDRVTLVARDYQERVTFDMNLSFHSGERTYALPGIVIGEIKQDRSLRRSPARDAIKSMGIRKTGFSKYCIGAALTHTDLKQNRFKKKLLFLEKLSRGGCNVC